MKPRSLLLALSLVTAFALPTARADDMAPLRALARGEAVAHPGARAMLALLDGVRDKDNTVRAMKWLQDAADRGRPEAQFQLAFQYETAPAPDFRRAAAYYQLAAEQGFALAQSNLASMYLFGKGVPRNPQKAMEWSLKAAEQGNAVSQARLGAMYFAGDGVPQDALQAEYWLAKAAEQGYADAQSHLGAMFLLGQAGAEKDVAKGLHWLRKAAEQGQPHARALLARAAKEGVPGASSSPPASAAPKS